MRFHQSYQTFCVEQCVWETTKSLEVDCGLWTVGCGIVTHTIKNLLGVMALMPGEEQQELSLSLGLDGLTLDQMNSKGKQQHSLCLLLHCYFLQNRNSKKTILINGSSDKAGR